VLVYLLQDNNVDWQGDTTANRAMQNRQLRPMVKDTEYKCKGATEDTGVLKKRKRAEPSLVSSVDICR
jgi:hypothetical protein